MADNAIDEIGDAAQRAADRLAAVARSRPLDRSRVEVALAAHLRGLELTPRPVRWIAADDPIEAAREGFIAAWAELWHKGKPLMPGGTFARTPGYDSLHRMGRPLLKAAKKEAKQAGRHVSGSAKKAGFAAQERLAGSPSAESSGHRVGGRVPASRRHDLETAGRNALHEKGLHKGLTGVVPGFELRARMLARIGMERDLREEIDVCDATWQAAMTVYWFTCAHVLRSAGTPTEAHERLAEAYLPLLDALEAGLWLYWITEENIIAVAAPASA